MGKKIKQFRALFLALVLLAGCSAPGIESSESLKRTGREAQREVREVSDNLEVHFLDVGQGDSTLITSGEHAMLIDGGNNNKGNEVEEYLESKGIEKLDYIIGTHPDADHVGGLDIVIKQIESEKLLVPDISKDTKTYEEVLEAADEKNVDISHPQVGEEYALGDASFTIIAPKGTGYESTNENSIGIILEHGEKRFLFIGDAEEESEGEMLKSGINLQADVYKVSHHGSRTGTTEEFMEAVHPQYAVISCGEDNSYGHPHAEVMNRLRSGGVSMFRTDDQGTIVAVSDGSSIKWNMSPSENWTAGEPHGSSVQRSAKKPSETVSKSASKTTPKTASKTQVVTYVLNVNTKKFHLPDCSSVADMKPGNSRKMKASREEMIKKGYTPCKNCLE